MLCLEENAIGPNNAMRNDDTIAIRSIQAKSTVEINNSDAERRLVLGDGVAHVKQPGHVPKLDLVIDMAKIDRSASSHHEKETCWNFSNVTTIRTASR
jgi:leucyl aminopeptidase